MLTKQDIFDLVEEEDVRFIRLQFTDMLGTMRNLAITTSRLEDALDNLCMFDGSSIMGFVGVEESDLYLHPDFDTFEIFPWRPHQGKVARLICDVYKPDGTRLESDPRYILQTVVKEAEEMGYKFNVGPECEFFLFNTDERGNPTTEPHDNAGYFDLAPLDNGENCRREICLTLEDMGYKIEASHHEMAPGQHEITFRYDDALKTADRIVTFRTVVKTIAKRNGLHATFMPKPIAGVSGSGMHLTMSLEKDGKNVFYNENDPSKLSDTALTGTSVLSSTILAGTSSAIDSSFLKSSLLSIVIFITSSPRVAVTVLVSPSQSTFAPSASNIALIGTSVLSFSIIGFTGHSSCLSSTNIFISSAASDVIDVLTIPNASNVATILLDFFILSSFLNQVLCVSLLNLLFPEFLQPTKSQNQFQMCQNAMGAVRVYRPIALKCIWN